MAVWSEFRMGQYNDDNRREDALHFKYFRDAHDFIWTSKIINERQFFRLVKTKWWFARQPEKIHTYQYENVA